ncbi:YceI family protein [Pseudalkalibacillus hwajinpoensis]|uniref:YceI family protein n=1 Tax=Guptibacillus hwajinpoensis TaxID=208199 RepID=UPI001CD645F3|nr:YceI family protein [Pseudalkalibacillus hwajinpoensis]MCA0993364.1 YceI family protein [Pseudalkalibacillus hwajinpoensis]
MKTLTLDKVHSSLDFQIKHMMVSKAKGEFTDFDVNFNGDLNDLTAANIKVTISVKSIDTGNEDRDGHLRSGDFFEADQYPNMVFESKSIKKKSDEEYDVTGNFTIKGVTKEETFTVEYNGTSKSPLDGSTVAGFDVSGKINREAYGMTYNAAIETGGFLLGKDVKFEGNFEFVVAD